MEYKSYVYLYDQYGKFFGEVNIKAEILNIKDDIMYKSTIFKVRRKIVYVAEFVIEYWAYETPDSK